MGNLISDKSKSFYFKLSTIGTDLFMKSLLISISNLAKNKWEKDFGIFIAERNQNILGGGLVGFDLSELGFSAQSFESQKKFVVDIIRNSIINETWNAFNYVTDNKSKMIDYFLKFEQLIHQFTIFDSNNLIYDIKFQFHNNTGSYKYCKLHHVLLIDNGDLGIHKCFVCDNIILNNNLEFNYKEINIYNSPVTKWHVTTQSTINRFEAIQIIDKLSDSVRGSDNEFYMLGNKWNEIAIDTAKIWIMDGLKYDLAYTSSENLSNSEIIATLRQDLNFFGDQKILYAYANSSNNPWKSKSYGSWSLTDWTLDAGIIIAASDKVILYLYRGED